MIARNRISTAWTSRCHTPQTGSSSPVNGAVKCSLMLAHGEWPVVSAARFCLKLATRHCLSIRGGTTCDVAIFAPKAVAGYGTEGGVLAAELKRALDKGFSSWAGDCPGVSLVECTKPQRLQWYTLRLRSGQAPERTEQGAGMKISVSFLCGILCSSVVNAFVKTRWMGFPSCAFESFVIKALFPFDFLRAGSVHRSRWA